MVTGDPGDLLALCWNHHAVFGVSDKSVPASYLGFLMDGLKRHVPTVPTSKSKILRVYAFFSDMPKCHIKLVNYLPLHPHYILIISHYIPLNILLTIPPNKYPKYTVSQ